MGSDSETSESLHGSRRFQENSDMEDGDFLDEEEANDEEDDSSGDSEDVDADELTMLSPERPAEKVS